MKLYIKQLFIFVFFVFCSHAKALEPLVVQGFPDDPRFSLTLLKEAIKRGNKYEILYYDEINGTEVSENKLREEVLNRKVDVFWTLTSAALEEEFSAVLVPIYRGMTGMRIALVRHDRTEMFKNVKTISDLTPFKAGQGTTWADTGILKHNNLQVITTLKYLNLFPMLEGGRFDYFPRGLPEPWGEMERENQYNLAVEPYLLFKYVAPLYYFTHHENLAVHKHITDNLEAMVADGTFGKMFFEDADIKAALSKANVKQRIIIPLDNPGVTKATPLNRKELWFDPTQ